MAETIAGLKIQIKLDGVEAASARFADLGRITGELKVKLAQINEAIKAAKTAGDPLKVEALKAAGKEIETAIARLGRLREAMRIEHARNILDVRPWRDIRREIEQARAAYARLAASGKLSIGEQAQAFAHLQNRIAELNAQTNGWAAALDRVRGALAGLAAGFAAFGLGVRNAVAFETAMVGVQRAASLTREETAALGQEFQRMSTRIAVAANDISRIAAMGAKFGVAKTDIARFAELTAIAARQFEMLPDEAGRSLGILSRLLGVSIKEMDAFIGMLNAAADSVGVAERDIIQALTLAGASAQQFGLTTNQATALATAFLSVGATAEQAGTAMRSLLSHIQAATQDTGEAGRALNALVGDTTAFSEAITRDAQGAINLLLGKLAELGREDRFAAIKAIFQEGLDTENISKLVSKLDQYKAAQDTAGKSADDFRAQLDKLNQTDLGTLGAEFHNLINAAENLGTSIGQTITPLVRAMAGALQEAAIAVKSLVDTFPNLSAALGIFATLAVGAGALRIALGGIALVMGKVLSSAALLLSPLRSLGVAMGALGATGPLIGRLAIAFRALLGPIGLVTTAITLGVDAWNAWRKSAQKAKDAAPGGATGKDASVKNQAENQATVADGVLRARLEWERLAESLNLKKPGQKMAAEIEKIRSLGARLKKPAEEIGRMIAAVRAKYAGGKDNDAAARLSLLKNEAEAEFALLKDGLERQKRALDASLEDRLVSIRDYYARKTAIEQQGIDAERARREQELAAARAIAANPKAGKSERLRALGEVKKLEAEIEILNRRRADVASENARRQAIAERELAGELARVRERLAEIEGGAGGEATRARLEREYQPLIEKLRRMGDEAGAADVVRLIDVESDLAELGRLERQYQTVTERMAIRERELQVQKEAGMITEMQMRREVLTLHQQTAAEVDGLIPKMQALADKTGSEEAINRVARLKVEVAGLKTEADDVATRINGDVQNAFASMFEAIGAGAKSAKDAFADFARSVIAGINRIASQKLAERIFGAIGGPGGGIAGALKFLGLNAGGAVPGTGSRDTVPALLTPGEYVIRRDVAQRLGRGLLDAINGGAWVPRIDAGRLAFASGGSVPQVAQPQVSQSVRVVNVVDPRMAADWMDSPAGERVLLNVIGRNAGAVRTLLAGA